MNNHVRTSTASSNISPDDIAAGAVVPAAEEVFPRFNHERVVSRRYETVLNDNITATVQVNAVPIPATGLSDVHPSHPQVVDRREVERP
jgi:hypothetical protein